MDALEQNAIRIKDSTDLHLKYALGWYQKFKIYYLFDSQKNKWKRLQWNDNQKMHWKISLMKKMDIWTHLYLG